MSDALLAEHPDHPGGPDPDCGSCNPEAPRRVFNNATPPSSAHPNVPGEYDAPGALVTHRFTSNSRGPGQMGMGVRITVTAYDDCLKCGGKKSAGPRPHAPHYQLGVGLVDCVGTLIRPLNELAEVTHG